MPLAFELFCDKLCQRKNALQMANLDLASIDYSFKKAYMSLLKSLP